MNNGASGVVKRSHLKEDAALGPNPMANGRVHKSRPQQHKDQHGRKLHAAGKRADHERRRQHGKRHLEDDEKIRGNTARRRLDVNAPQKHVIRPHIGMLRGKQLQLRLHQRQRRAQLVGGVAGELPLGGKGVIQPLQHLIEGLTQLPELRKHIFIDPHMIGPVSIGSSISKSGSVC